MECPRCSTSNPDQARFCLNCGSPLAERTQLGREERKTVSVLFADLVGFTARAEKLDPEDVDRILRPYHDRLRTDLERHGGTVEKFIGDAVMAVFGAPTAREDDAERAVRAALAIRDWAREQDGVELRIGVNSGEALVSIDARPEYGQAMVKGDVVNTAARLQAAAPINGILVGPTTYRATRDAISYEPAEPVQAKGKSEPIEAWTPSEARSRFGVDVRQVGGKHLVGRQRELAALSDTLARVLSANEPQLVTLVGVPGMGKSRLVWELFQQLDAAHEMFTWRQGRSVPYGEGVSFWALGEIVKAQAGILESDSISVASDKLTESVARLLGESAGHEWVLSHLSPLIGLERQAQLAQAQQGEAFAAWRRYLESVAAQRPLVLVFEDLHWADDGLLDFVDHLAEWVTGVPLLLLGTARPELLARRPAWGGGKSNSLTLSLSPLSDAETTQLVHQLFERSVLPAETQQALLERAGGNPLYAEEFVRLMSEGRTDTIPEGVQAIIAARLDALPMDDKRLLQDAAVLGKVFWAGALAEISARPSWAVDEALHTLERREFVRREQRSSVAGETEFAFRHALVREAAYEQLPRSARAEQHRRAARWIESLARPEDTAEMLAHHYLAAVEYARAAGQPVDELIGPARSAFGAAGQRALGLSAFASARRFYGAALELTPRDDPERALLLLAYGRAIFGSDLDEAQQVLSDASRRLAELGNRERAAEAEVLLAQLHWHRGARTSADEHLARAEALIADAGPTPSRARVLTELSRYHMLAFRAEASISLGREAIELARRLDLPEIEAHALNNVGSARGFAGDAAGMNEVEQGLQIALTINSPEAARAYNNLAAATALRGDLKRSAELRRLAAETDRKFGGEAILRFASGALIINMFLEGRWDECLQGATEFAAASERLGRSYQELYHGCVKAMIEVARDQVEVALATASSIAEWGRQIGEPQAVVPALGTLAHVHFELGHVDQGAALLDEIAARVPTNTLFDWMLAAAMSAPDALTRQRIQAITAPSTSSKLVLVIANIAAGRLVAAADLLADGGWVSYEAMARTQAAAEFAAAGRRSEADAQLRLVLPFWRSVGANRYAARAEALLSKTG